MGYRLWTFFCDTLVSVMFRFGLVYLRSLFGLTAVRFDVLKYAWVTLSIANLLPLFAMDYGLSTIDFFCNTLVSVTFKFFGLCACSVYLDLLL